MSERYYMKEFRESQFYSTAELAEKLRMNIQVIARKLQSGEIEGYKIGKDWRVEEDALQKWLAAISNQRLRTPQQAVIDHFIKNGRLTHMPAQRKKKIYILEFFLRKFELWRTYAETEVNSVISEHFDDFCTVRREFIMNKMMTRKDGRYQRNSSYIFSK